MHINHFLNHIAQLELPGLAAHKEMSFTNRNFEKPISAVKSAVSIVLFEKDDELFFPLIKRSTIIKHHKGQIALPGGKLNENESILDAAMRETEEEIGLSKKYITPIRTLTELYIPVSNHLVYPVVCYSSEIPSFNYISNEVDKLFFCSIQDLIHLKRQMSKVRVTDNLIIEAPSFIYHNEIIWGATALILNEFKILISKIL